MGKREKEKEAKEIVVREWKEQFGFTLNKKEIRIEEYGWFTGFIFFRIGNVGMIFTEEDKKFKSQKDFIQKVNMDWIKI